MEHGAVTVLARSLAGHDRNRVYAVVGEEEPYFFLADGKHHTLARPKKKKKKHVQVISHLTEELLLLGRECSDDAGIRRMLKAYHLR